MKHELPVKDIQDYKTEFEDIKKIMMSINSNLLAVEFDFHNYLTYSPGDNNFYRIRDSIFFRLDSCKFILTQFELNNKDLNTILNSTKIGREKMSTMSFINNSNTVSYSLYDSLLFNLKILQEQQPDMNNFQIQNLFI